MPVLSFDKWSSRRKDMQYLEVEPSLTVIFSQLDYPGI